MERAIDIDVDLSTIPLYLKLVDMSTSLSPRKKRPAEASLFSYNIA